MASKKSILPIVAIGAVAAFALMGSKSASAKSSVPLDDELPPPDDSYDLPSPDNSSQQDSKSDVWKVEPESGPLTKDEENAIKLAMTIGGVKVDPTYYPSPYNTKKQGQSMLDWKTNLAYWTAYATSQSPWVLAGNEPAPFKIKKGQDKWAAIWLKLRNAIAYLYPDVEVNPSYTQGLIK
jgi:hypothetical protein